MTHCVRRLVRPAPRVGGGSRGGWDLPGARNRRRLGLKRRPSGGCRLRMARCGGIYENQSPYGLCLDPAVASFREFPASRAEKFLGRHMERVVGRQGSHVDHDRRQSGRKLRIPRSVHAGGKEQSDSEKSDLHKQWDHRYADKDRQDDGICDVAQFAGRHDCPTDEAVERRSRVLSGPSRLHASLDAPERAEPHPSARLDNPPNRFPYVLMEVETLGMAQSLGWKAPMRRPQGFPRRREVDAAMHLNALKVRSSAPKSEVALQSVRKGYRCPTT